MFGAIVMIPLYLQVVKGYSASDAGIKLIPLMLGILTMSIYSGKDNFKTWSLQTFPSSRNCNHDYWIDIDDPT